MWRLSYRYLRQVEENSNGNVLQDVKTEPEVILSDFSKPNPLVTLKKEDIVFTYASGSNTTSQRPAMITGEFPYER